MKRKKNFQFYYTFKLKWFNKAIACITFIFFGMLILVTLLAYARSSGSTGLDMAKIQNIRHNAFIISP